MTATVPTLALERLGPWGRTLTVSPPGDDERALPSAALVTGPTLATSLRAYAQEVGTDSLAVAASAWSKQHAKAVLPGPLAAHILLDTGWDLSPHNTHLHLSGPTPAAVRLLDAARAEPGPLGRDLLLQSLFADHLAPLYERLHEVSGLGRHVLWNNAGNLIAWMLDRFAEDRPDNPRIFPLRRLLLDSPAAWGADENPLRDPVSYETLELARGPYRNQVRRVCCLRHRLPGLDACTTCPQLSHEERQDLLRRLERTA